MSSINEYLSLIGVKGGQKSRRTLEPGGARDVVRVREARKAFRRFRALCFWSAPPDLTISLEDVPWVPQQLKRHGDRQAWEVGVQLCR